MLLGGTITGCRIDRYPGVGKPYILAPSTRHCGNRSQWDLLWTAPSRTVVNGMSESRAKLSAGTLLYRIVDGTIEVLLVHPAGNYNRRAPWGIPKGAPDPEEELEATA